MRLYIKREQGTSNLYACNHGEKLLYMQTYYSVQAVMIYGACITGISKVYKFCTSFLFKELVIFYL